MKSPSLLAATLLLVLSGCRVPSPASATGDQPRIPATARMTDLTLHSAILHQDVAVRIVAPANVAAGQPLAVLYVLHGAGEDYRNWTNESSIAELAQHNVLLVMPDGLRTYYVNDARGHRYEDFFFQELIPAIHQHFPAAATDRAHTAILGNSRGGFAATLYGLKHPELFSYVVGMSSAMDLADRRFRWHTPRESWGYRRIFGPPGSSVRRDNDPFRLAKNIPLADAPYLDLSCAKDDVLLPANQTFAALLAQRGLAHRFDLVAGNHDFGVWNHELPGVEQRLLAHFGRSSSASPSAAKLAPHAQWQ